MAARRCLVVVDIGRAVCVKVRMTMCGGKRERSLVAEASALEPALLARLSEAQGGLHLSAFTNHVATQPIDFSRPADSSLHTSSYSKLPEDSSQVLVMLMVS